MSKDFLEETKSYISYFITDYTNTYRAWSEVAMTLQGANESCRNYQNNCKGVAEIKAEYTKKEKELKAAKVELNTKRAALLRK